MRQKSTTTDAPLFPFPESAIEKGESVTDSIL